MKIPFFLLLRITMFLCALSFAWPVYSQNTHDALQKRAAAPISQTKNISINCDDDKVTPTIQSPHGVCDPSIRAAYLSSYTSHAWGYPSEPYGASDNLDAMSAVFADSWDRMYFEHADVNQLFSPAYKVVFLEGSSYYNGDFLNNFLAGNRILIEHWVATGGTLLLSCSNHFYSGVMQFGFGGVWRSHGAEAYELLVKDPANSIFEGPFTPANGPFASSGSLPVLRGPVGNALITDKNGTGTLLSEKTWGLGKVYFSTLDVPAYTSPYSAAQNLRQNIFADLNARCGAHIELVADDQQCSFQVIDASLDATATDDCILASLTHDFAAAPSNITLNGAALPVGITKVIWTAVDAAGNSSSSESSIFVRELEPPVLSCPQDITVQADMGKCTATPTALATATDNCGGQITYLYSSESGHSFSVGTTSAICTALDASGNQSLCIFNLIVTPNVELCNGLDDDCNGIVDDNVQEVNTFYRDADGDGYGDVNPATPTVQGIGCYPPYGYSTYATDCDDSNYYIHPNAAEYCDDLDNNCDGQTDEGVTPTWYADTDGDGYGDANVSKASCAQPTGYVSNDDDCDDKEAYIHPGALEDCTNVVDDNCDGIIGSNDFSIDVVQTDVKCGSTPDGKIAISMTPAQEYPVVRWSTGAVGPLILENLDAGTYKVTVTNECGTTKTKSIVIAPSSTPALQVALSGTAQICGGSNAGSITALASAGCGNFTYTWFDGSTNAAISGLSGGTYQVVAKDDCGCSRTSIFTIAEPSQLELIVTYTILLLDGTYFVQVFPYNGIAPYQFRRSLSTGGSTAWGPSNGFLGVPSGESTFEVQDANGCIEQLTITLAPAISPHQGLEEEATERAPVATPTQTSRWEISLFPNPNSGDFSVKLPENAVESTFFITNSAGQIVQEHSAGTDSRQTNIQMRDLPNGLYFVQIVSKGRVVAVEQFVLQGK
jgi:Putative metal-binding motif/Secretion system C-terminal sorting domain/HYR domain